MAKIGSIKEEENSLLQIIKSSDKVDIIYVKYKEKNINVRLVKRSGKRMGNDVYVDVIKIPVGARIKFKEDNTFEDIWLSDKNFFQYLNGKISKDQYLQIQKRNTNLGCCMSLIVILTIIFIITLFY